MSNENLLLQDISVISQYEPEEIMSKLTEINDQECEAEENLED